MRRPENWGGKVMPDDVASEQEAGVRDLEFAPEWVRKVFQDGSLEIVV